tara:strand:+ start:10772 stop:11608 length:837 start_codon:yes stop_codon:yes gene_type:complete
MLLKSFSKINLSLTVNKKKKMNLHQIQTFFCLINLYDEIRFKKIKGKKDIVKFKGKFSKRINKTKNTVTKTLGLLRREKIIKNYYLVEVNKKIPISAGLGGGTSNSFFLAKQLAGKRFNKNLINKFEGIIGSDFKLFLHKQGFMRNLSNISNFNKRYKANFLLIYPHIQSSTKLVYSKLKKFSMMTKVSLNKINNKIQFFGILFSKKNDLQQVVEKKYPIINKIVNEIAQNTGCYFSRMTGSGSVCYGIFQSEKTAKIALNRIKKKYPRFWISIAKTI